jgi:nitrogen fixation protein NifU and related proteins
MIRENTKNQTGRRPERGGVSAKVVHHAMEPTHYGEMTKPDGHAVITGSCGDTDEFFVRIFGSRILEIRFRTTGCFFTVAACDAVAFLAEGRTVHEATKLTQESVLEYLGGLPDDHKHCALLAVNTLLGALGKHIHGGDRPLTNG